MFSQVQSFPFNYKDINVKNNHNYPNYGNQLGFGTSGSSVETGYGYSGIPLSGYGGFDSSIKANQSTYNPKLLYGPSPQAKAFYNNGKPSLINTNGFGTEGAALINDLNPGKGGFGTSGMGTSGMGTSGMGTSGGELDDAYGEGMWDSILNIGKKIIGFIKPVAQTLIKNKDNIKSAIDTGKQVFNTGNTIYKEIKENLKPKKAEIKEIEDKIAPSIDGNGIVGEDLKILKRLSKKELMKLNLTKDKSITKNELIHMLKSKYKTIDEILKI
jgi:hypothetical protein